MKDYRQTPHQNDRIAQLSNTQLEFLARQELNKSEEIDVQLLQNIGKEFDARDPAGAADAKAAWEDFKAHYLGTEPLYPMDTSEEQDTTLAVVVRQARARGIDTIRGYYYKTAKNNMVREFWADFGFRLVAQDGDDTVWELNLADYTPKNHVIRVNADAV